MSYPKKTQQANKTATKTSAAVTDKSAAQAKKRDQLRSLLVSKFKTKYASELKSGNLESIVTHEIDAFLAQGNLTEPNLMKLDQKIAETVKAITKPKAVPKKEQPADSKTVTTKQEESPAPEPLPASSHDPVISDAWGCVVDYNKKLHEEEKVALVVKQKEMKTKLKQDLDRQMEEKRRIQAENIKKEQELEAKQVNLETQLQNNEKAKEQKMRQQVCKQKLEAQKIFEHDKAKKQADLIKERQTDFENVKRMQDDFDKEHGKSGKDKTLTKKIQGEMNKALEENKKKLEEAKKRDELIDQQKSREAEEIQTREKMHQDDASKRKKDQLRALEKAAEKTAQITSKPGPKEKLISKQDVTSLPIVDKVSDKVSQLKKDTVDVLKKQMQEKQVREIEEKKTSEMYMKRLQKDTEEQTKKEKTKADNTKKALYENKETIINQMEEKKQKMKNQMAKEELLFNKELIERATGTVIKGISSPKAQ